MGTMKYDVQNILDGSVSINAAATKLGIHASKLWRDLVKHPDYAKAKAEGRIRPSGIAAKLDESPHAEAVCDMILGGSTIAEAAERYGMPASSAAKLFHKRHPDINLARRNASAEEVAQLAKAKAERALRRAQKALSKLAEVA